MDTILALDESHFEMGQLVLMVSSQMQNFLQSKMGQIQLTLSPLLMLDLSDVSELLVTQQGQISMIHFIVSELDLMPRYLIRLSSVSEKMSEF